MLSVERVVIGRVEHLVSGVWGAIEEDVDDIKDVGNPLPRDGYVGVGVDKRFDMFGFDCGLVF